MVAIGRVVDDAIVVLENISRHVTEGESPLAAAYTGGREIVTAVTSSTLTTVAVSCRLRFSPASPQLLPAVRVDRGHRVACVLLVAITVVPLLASRFLKPQPPAGRRQATAQLAAGRLHPVIRWPRAIAPLPWSRPPPSSSDRLA